jgi:hypothetical protein
MFTWTHMNCYGISKDQNESLLDMKIECTVRRLDPVRCIIARSIQRQKTSTSTQWKCNCKYKELERTKVKSDRIFTAILAAMHISKIIELQYASYYSLRSPLRLYRRCACSFSVFCSLDSHTFAYVLLPSNLALQRLFAYRKLNR